MRRYDIPIVAICEPHVGKTTRQFVLASEYDLALARIAELELLLATAQKNEARYLLLRGTQDLMLYEAGKYTLIWHRYAQPHDVDLALDRTLAEPFRIPPKQDER